MSQTTPPGNSEHKASYLFYFIFGKVKEKSDSVKVHNCTFFPLASQPAGSLPAFNWQVLAIQVN